MKEAKIDVAVLLLFFVRADKTKQVFEAIKEARPSKLFLFQDGPRKDRNDMPGILACRKIVEDIDWECEVYKNYQEKNLGCDPSEYVSQKWMFSIVDKGIVLEDDDVPSQSFFPFCKELLDRYEKDERINMICGMNNLGTYDCPNDYFFSQSGSIWGWASWRRVIDEWDSTYEFLNCKYVEKVLEFNKGKDWRERYYATCRRHLNSGREHYETIFSSNTIIKNRLNIIPKYNMIKNIGVGVETTHGVASLKEMPPAVRAVFYMKTYDYTFPLNHPKYIIDDREYAKKVRDQLRGTKLERFFHIRGIRMRISKLLSFFKKK